jgi:23S rRNA (pseudouridine1915-N3)-methyltransferase
MLLTFIWVGKTRNSHWAALEGEYMERIQHFARTRVRTVREMSGEWGSRMVQKALEQEGESILKAVSPEAYVILMDERGTPLDSRGLAQSLARRQDGGTRETVLIVGGASGVAPKIRQRADFTLSISRMTFPHEMVRTILLEQVYRAFAIIHNLPYPK